MKSIQEMIDDSDNNPDKNISIIEGEEYETSLASFTPWDAENSGKESLGGGGRISSEGGEIIGILSVQAHK